MLFPERFDARLEPDGWQCPAFDDAAWQPAALVDCPDLAPPTDLLPRPIPMIREQRLDPVRLIGGGTCRDEDTPDLVGLEDIATSLWRSTLEPDDALSHQPWEAAPHTITIPPGEARYRILDFGHETLAAPELVVEGPAGVIVDLGYSEALWLNRVHTRWQTIPQSERVILRDGVTAHRLLQPRGFRFMILRFANPGDAPADVTLKDIAAHEAIYPTRPRGSFHCSDKLLDRIYRLAARTVNLCMEDGYTDCPWRERAQWVGDAQPETLFSYFAFGEYELARKAVLEFTSGNTDEGWIPGVFPTGRPMNLPTWGMRVPVIA